MSCATRCGRITKHPPAASRNIGRRCRREPCAPALALIQILAASGQDLYQAIWATLATQLLPEATCADLVAAYAREHVGQPLAGLAALLFRLQPKVRLM
jgi:hypothetical protein